MAGENEKKARDNKFFLGTIFGEDLFCQIVPRSEVRAAWRSVQLCTPMATSASDAADAALPAPIVLLWGPLEERRELSVCRAESCHVEPNNLKFVPASLSSHLIDEYA